ncbi:MAG: aminoglycoside 6-adenylyltransferase [Chloroflexi bacterium]|nr:aminoglycoside 6-adenylyltransferase [Chloroflexota bacterium]MCY3582936.1 aminoglycoside 6-adenylyltransferase [Chloroflexota bacterium]MCY3715914.1 aminoglycoside 6-adenylyltransferase [Chloroflexota bacterium]MDE2649697.1 aminoglycoside 6-adenylyltransferase [Chloroflexota bacterium]MXX83218.1 aminoglycoside 6-adenylyltransferase [Chloroflexota bacterium]
MVNHPLLPAIVAWARGEDAIRAVVITGSLARADGSADEYSDLDAQIITSEIARYCQDDRWLDELGEVWIRFPLGETVPYRLVWFAGGSKVDFQFMHIDEIRTMIVSQQLSDEYLRGYHVALDKAGLYEGLPPSPRSFPQPPAPSREQVYACLNEFWFEALHAAQFIRRREFWVVKFRDWTMKTMLLQALEWRARATADAPTNTWLLGKRMHEWARGDEYAAITRIWAGWDARQLWQALLIQADIFAVISDKLCAALGYEQPIQAREEIRAYIHALYAEDPEARR